MSSNLHYRVAFEPPLAEPDGSGGIETGWDTDNAIEARAHFRFLRGGESVQAARLGGKQPIIATIPNSSAGRSITSDWRMRDVRSGKEFQIRTDPVLTDDRAWLEVLVESGVAV